MSINPGSSPATAAELKAETSLITARSNAEVSIISAKAIARNSTILETGKWIVILLLSIAGFIVVFYAPSSLKDVWVIIGPIITAGLTTTFPNRNKTT